MSTSEARADTAFITPVCDDGEHFGCRLSGCECDCHQPVRRADADTIEPPTTRCSWCGVRYDGHTGHGPGICVNPAAA